MKCRADHDSAEPFGLELKGEGLVAGRIQKDAGLVTLGLFKVNHENVPFDTRRLKQRAGLKHAHPAPHIMVFGHTEKGGR